MEKPVIDRTPIVDKIYKDLRHRIIRAELLPDTKLGVRELCEYYGVSDTPIKQALNRLVSDGLVEAIAHCGMRVRRITEADIREASEARLMIERFSVPYAIEASKHTDVCERLRRCIEENEVLIGAVLSGDDSKALEELRTSQEFHKIIVDCTKNKLISDTYEKTLNCQYVYYQQNVGKAAELKKSLNEHIRILEALEAGNAAEMAEAICEHLKFRECAALFAALGN